MSHETRALSASARSDLLRFAKNLAREAGDILVRGYNKPRTVSHKGAIDLVTDTDLKSEKLIRRRISANYPDHEILAEEGGASETQTESPFRWVVDPLDGTTNFAHGYPVFCVSIALEFARQTVLGVVYDPLRDELFSAAQGDGGRLNRKRLKVSKTRTMQRALCATGFPYDMHTSNRDNLDNFNRVIKRAQGVRRGGSAALDLCYLAAGRFDVYWELKLSPWDTAAGALIAREAGANVTDLSGKSHQIEKKEILAANPTLSKQMLKLLR